MGSVSHKLVAVIPAYQCAATVREVVEGVRRQGVAPVVVDDGSTDGTEAVARAAGATVLRHHRNLGKGSALATGFRWALAQGVDHVLTLDADLQHDPEEIRDFVELLGEADLVVGQRRLALSHMPAGRLVGNRISTFFIGLFCGCWMHDTQCGYRLHSRRLLSAVPLHGGHFETETEILMRARLLGLTVRWVPIETLYPPGRAATHFDNLRDTLRVIRVVLRSPWYPRGTVGG